MPGCCVLALLVFFGPRVLLVFSWIFTRWFDAIGSTLVALAGVILLPWTTLAWMYTYCHNDGQASSQIWARTVAVDVTGRGGRGGVRASSFAARSSPSWVGRACSRFRRTSP